MCVWSHFSHVWLFVTEWTVAHQAPLSTGFSRQDYWSGQPCPPPGDLPNPGIEPTSLMSPALVGRSFTTSATWEALKCIYVVPDTILNTWHVLDSFILTTPLDHYTTFAEKALVYSILLSPYFTILLNGWNNYMVKTMREIKGYTSAHVQMGYPATTFKWGPEWAPAFPLHPSWLCTDSRQSWRLAALGAGQFSLG